MSQFAEDSLAELHAAEVELALLRGEAQPEPTRILESPAEILKLAAKGPAAPEDALLPELKPDLSLDDGFVIQQMIETIRESEGWMIDDAMKNYELARRLSVALLALRHGPAKLLWTRRDLHEVFRRSGSILEREVRKRVQAGAMP